MGVAMTGVDSDGAFSSTDVVGTAKSGYLKNDSFAFDFWGGYVTFYYLSIVMETEYLYMTGVIPENELEYGMLYMVQKEGLGLNFQKLRCFENV